MRTSAWWRSVPWLLGVLVYSLVWFGHSIGANVGTTEAVASVGTTLATSSSSQAFQRPAQDKVAYLHDGSLLVGYFDGSRGVIDQVKNPSTSPSVQQVLTISGDEVTLYTQPGAGSTDIWIQVGGELVGSAPLEQIQHGIYNGTSFTWDAATAIPGAVAPGRQDPSVTWTGKWLIATWWDDTNFANSDTVFMNWTADKTGTSGWRSSAILLNPTAQNIVQISIRHSAKLGATVIVYGAHYRISTRTLLDSKADPSLANWTPESRVDPGYDDSESGFGGPQLAIDESSGKIHVFRAVTNSGGPTWAGVTYWLGTPDAVPMVTGAVSWRPRLIIDSSANSSDPPDVAGAVDSSGKVYVFWATSVSSGVIKYATLVSPYTSASATTTLVTNGSPRYPHLPAQAPLSRGYVPVVYQAGGSIILDTSILAAGSDTSPPTAPTGLAAAASSSAPQVNLSWNASSDNVGVSGYTIYRNGTTLATVPGTSLTYADNTVASLTTYSYAVDAFDAAANHSARSGSVSVTTPDTSPPTVPAGLSATAVSPSKIDVSWNASSDNVGVTGYTVFRNGAFLTTATGGATSWADTTVAGSTTYSYAVDAFDAAGNHSTRSAPVSATTPGVPDTQAPTTPGAFAASATSPTAVSLSWSASTDNVGVTGYTIYRDGLVAGTVGPSALGYQDTVAAGSTHSYTVDAYDAAGNHSATPTSITVTTPTADTTPPSVPTGLSAIPGGSTQVNLAWKASTDNVGVAGYTVYRNSVALKTVGSATLAYSDTSVSSGATYTYSVDAFDAAGNHSAQSATVSVHIPGVAAFVRAGVVTTGSRVTSVTLALGPVAAGHLLAGWFGQYDSPGQVAVSDNINGAWTRSASTTWHGGSAPGDIALYYRANSAAAPGGLTITITSTSATYLQAAAAEYSGVATVNPLDQVVVAKGSGATADSGLTAAVSAGELVFGGMTATNGAGALTPGASQGVAFVARSQSSSGTQGEEDIVSGAAGQQHAVFTFPTSTPWFIVCAVFKPA